MSENDSNEETTTARGLRRRLLKRAKELESALTDEDLATNSDALRQAQRAWDAYAAAFNAGASS